MCTARIKRILMGMVYGAPPVELKNDSDVYKKYQTSTAETRLLAEGPCGQVVKYKWNGQAVAAKLYGYIDSPNEDIEGHRKVAQCEINALIGFIIPGLSLIYWLITQVPGHVYFSNLWTIACSA